MGVLVILGERIMKKSKNIIRGFGRKINDYVGYILNYKNHVDEEKARDNKIIELNAKITKLENEKQYLNQAQKEFLKQIDKKSEYVETLKEDFSTKIKEVNSKIDDLTIQLDTKDKLLIKESKKFLNLEKTNKKLQKEIEKLTEKLNDSDLLVASTLADLDVANNKIQFYKSKIPKPTLKELKDYKYKRKHSSDKYV